MPKMHIIKEIIEYIDIFQRQWRRLSNLEIPNEDFLREINAKLGVHHREHDSELYIKNASLVLNFLALRVPDIIRDTIAQSDEGAYVSAATELVSVMRAKVNRAVLYLDDKHGVAYLYDSQELFEKALLMEWLFTKLATFYQRSTALPPFINCLVYVFFTGSRNEVEHEKLSWKESAVYSMLEMALMRNKRKRLPTLTQRLDDYVRVECNIIKREPVDELEQYFDSADDVALPAAVILPEARAQVEVEQVNPATPRIASRQMTVMSPDKSTALSESFKKISENLLHQFLLCVDFMRLSLKEYGENNYRLFFSLAHNSAGIERAIKYQKVWLPFTKQKYTDLRDYYSLLERSVDARIFSSMELKREFVFELKQLIAKAEEFLYDAEGGNWNSHSMRSYLLTCVLAYRRVLNQIVTCQDDAFMSGRFVLDLGEPTPQTVQALMAAKESVNRLSDTKETVSVARNGVAL